MKATNRQRLVRAPKRNLHRLDTVICRASLDLRVLTTVFQRLDDAGDELAAAARALDAALLHLDNVKHARRERRPAEAIALSRSL